jgi:PKD repeat protein
MIRSKPLLLAVLALALLSTGLAPVAGRAVPAALADGQPTPVRVYFADRAMGNSLFVAFEPFVMETDYEASYHVMLVTQSELDKLSALGVRVEADPAWVPPQGGIATIPGYSCYRTVEESYAAAEALVTAHPTLASWLDVGNSWLKTQLSGGYDMRVLKITNSAVPGDKPDLFITASIHAREYTPAETATRFGEYLVNNYGVDPDVTWLVDYHETHIMMQANPDGRKKAETGLSWRKNVDNNYCGNTNSRGADLNRNFAFKWGCCGGSSGYPCDDTYRGPTAGSEPETQAVQNYMTAIFPDQRGPGDTDPAPADATGIYLDLHSYSELVLWPWGWTSTNAPNFAQLQTLGRKMAYFNDYSPQKSYSLYPTDGTTDDHSYGLLGVASYCIEMGTSFFQSCTTFENTIYPDNLQTLLFTAKVARTPYMTPLGPDALSVAVAPAEVPQGSPATLTATVNDTRFNNSNGTEPTQNIAAAEYYVDTPPWATGAVALAMAASDGSFNSKVEGVTAAVDTSGLSVGRHILFVRGKDVSGNWGAVSAVFLEVTQGSCDPVTGAAFTWTPASPFVGDVVSFSGSASGTAPIAYAWAFGDGTTGAGQAVTHTYTTAGTYSVTMTASNACGSQVVSHPITVQPPVGNKLHVNGLLLSYTGTAVPYKLRSVITVHDQAHARAAGVTVYGTWTLPNGRSINRTALTNQLGKASIPMSGKAGTYQLCVTDLVKAGYSYDPAGNEVPACQTITVP